MDIRLMLDVGASQAPPGRKTEPPPKCEEFEKTLQMAKMEETPGEVAETEPNAQLQTLDPERKEAEKSETGSKEPVGPPIALPLIDPNFASRLNLVELSQFLPNGGGFKGFTLDQGTKPISAPIMLGQQKAVPFTSPAVQVIDTTKVSAPIDLVSTPLDATSNKALGSLIESTFNSKASTESLQSVVISNNEAQTTPTSIKPEVKVQIDQQLSSQIKAQLNVTSVQSLTSAVINTSASPKLAEAQVVVNQKVATIEVKSESGKPQLTAPEVVPVDGSARSLEQAFESATDSSDSKDDDKPDCDLPLPVSSQQTPTIDSPKESKPISASQMTSSERQVMIDSIAKRIDELASRSVRNEVRVEMHPPELGSVVVNLRKDLTGLTATLNASNEPLRQALHESRNDLAGALSDRNVGQVRIEVRGASADTMNMGQQQQNQAQSNHQQYQDHQTKQASQFAQRSFRESLETVESPAKTRVITTLLDMEI